MSTMAALAGDDSPALRRRDWLTIALIGLVHASSHFFQLVIPSLYVALGSAFNLDFAALGLLVSAFFVVSGVGQASSGFLVDRIGARPVLWFGLACFVVAGLLIASANGYAMLMAAALIAGLGNSIFHPADYAIINLNISRSRLGHAFSVHGVSGNLGWAAGPVFIAAVTHWAGWRMAALAAAGVVALVLLASVLGRRLLQVDVARQAGAEQAGIQAQSGERKGAVSPAEGALARVATLLAIPALWGAFLFLAATTVANSAMQNYTIPLMGDLYYLTSMQASSALSLFMVAAAAGMLAGGFLANLSPRTEWVVLGALAVAALLLAMLAMRWVPVAWALPVLALAGLCSGMAGPSRDLLIRRVTPKGAVGSVYGLVYSGMDVGSASGPLLFGVMLDHGFQQGPWLGAAVALLAAALLALWVGRQPAPQVSTARS
ncbi:MFS transporter [Corticimicrobacter populi]|uniref:MFS transporter n=1 Tax=Corticimicrobacter populi TaxID=2175229 RepID=A0A2V1JWM2_9BURK|nr:MFS transporter [Corticimicrobacter populi]PWF22727.1 MFS transporter [Corticimicrobacter populi]